MPKPSTTCPTTNINIDVEDRATLAHILHNRFAHLDAGEVRAMLETTYPAAVWVSEELLTVFEVSHFEPPYVHVIRKTDGLRGTVVFIDAPRFYFAFQPLLKDCQ